MLPKVKNLIFDVHIKELNKTVKIRPFTVGENKQILTAIMLKDPAAMTNLLHDIVKSCVIGDIDLDNLPSYVFDYVYLKIWMHSKSDMAPINYRCLAKTQKIKETYENGEKKTEEVVEACDTILKINLPLTKAEIIKPENFEPTKVINFGNNDGIKMKMPNLKDFREFNYKSEDNDEVADRFIMACVDCIFDADNVYIPGKDFTFEEFRAWFNDLDGMHLKEIEKFMKDIPAIGLDYVVECPKCRTQHRLNLRGLDDFFP